MSLIMTNDNIYATKVLKILLTPFNQQKAYKLGLINERGDQIKRPDTREEEEAMSPLFVVLFKLKQILAKLPASNSRLAQVAVALQFIRQKNIPSQYKTGLAESYAEDFLNRLIFVAENKLRLVEEETFITKYLENIIVEEGEGAPATMTTTAAVEPKGEPVIKPKKKKIEEGVEYKTLYVSRPVLNRGDILAWATVNGIKTVQDDLHTTICYSKTEVSGVTPDKEKITLDSDESRTLALFGKEKDVLVLKIESKEFSDRWKEFINAGASWDWPDYSPHVTITISADGIDLDKIEPYTGKIVYGPEIFAEVEEDWHDKATES